jgi:hypothetical protein
MSMNRWVIDCVCVCMYDINAANYASTPPTLSPYPVNTNNYTNTYNYTNTTNYTNTHTYTHTHTSTHTPISAEMNRNVPQVIKKNSRINTFVLTN